MGQIRRIEHRLSATLAVAEVDKEDASQVTPGMDPTGESDGLTGVRGPKFVAMLRAFHDRRAENQGFPAAKEGG